MSVASPRNSLNNGTGFPSTPVPALGPSSRARFTVRSSDVVSDNRINVLAAGTNTVIWYKEVFLTEHEIVEHVVDNATSRLLWTIHKPLRGWYIRLRAPNFPPNSPGIALEPLSSASPLHVPAALYLMCKTLTPSAPAAPPSAPDSHTYPPPPTPPAVVVSPPSPSSVHAKLAELESPALRTRTSSFVLSPHVHAIPHKQEGIFARMARAISTNAPTVNNSFSLSPVIPSTTTASPPITPTPNSAAPMRRPLHPDLAAGALGEPLVVFRDTTPVWTMNASSGELELDLAQISTLGVDVVFWVAAALAYTEFLGDREGYLAAASD
ncbi:unnamed protein product [Peniophora sp. CBMAI 1063]|nr:unnamed protein product [Peniophora sp. CBMAI 1063]